MVKQFPPAIGPFQRDDQGRPRVLPDVVYLLLNSIGRAALGATLVPGLGEKWRESIEEHVRKVGKFTKAEVVYSPVAPPPVFWEYNCGQCWAFLRESQTCRWITERGWPNPGIIHPQGWCVIWMPKEGDWAFSYLRRLPWLIREPAPVFP